MTARSLLLPALAGALLTLSAPLVHAQRIVTPASPASGNTGSLDGVAGGAGIGDTPSTAPTGVDPGSVRVRPAAPAPGTTVVTPGGTVVTPGATVVTPGTPRATNPGIGDQPNGVTRSSGVGIGESSTTRDTGSPSYGAGITGTGSLTRPASEAGSGVQGGVAPAAQAPTSEGNGSRTRTTTTTTTGR